MWNIINNAADLRFFEEYFDRFHDSCIKETKYLSGAYVLANLSMHPVNDKRILRIIFQRQSFNPSVIEVEFSGLIHLHMVPLDENYTCEIVEATFEMTKEGFVWYDSEPLSDEAIKKYNGTKIFAVKVKWRVADEYIGEKEIYA